MAESCGKQKHKSIKNIIKLSDKTNCVPNMCYELNYIHGYYYCCSCVLVNITCI